MTVNQAKETKVFILNPNDEKGLNFKIKIEEINLYDHVIESRDETTTPRGVGAARRFVEAIDLHDFKKKEQIWINDSKFCGHFTRKEAKKEGMEIHTISTWGVTGSRYIKGTDYYSSEEEAENKLFQDIYDYDFQQDCHRNTEFFEYIDEAKERVLEEYSYAWSVSKDVVKSILKHRELADTIEEKRSLEVKRQNAKIQEQNEKLAAEYSKLIDPKFESFKETATRLSNALDEKISKSVFFAAVKMIRSRHK